MNQQQGKPQSKGIYDKDKDINPENLAINSSEKKDFKDPFIQQQSEINERSKRSVPSIEELAGDSTLNNTANAVNNAGPGRNVQADLDEMEKFSKEDIELAEQMIFKGFAEFDTEIDRFKGYKFTIGSTTAEEIAIIDEIVFDFVKRSEGSDGVVNLPQNNVQSFRNSLFIAISYRGMNQEELAKDNSSCHLNTIKKAVIRVSDLEDGGQLKEAETLKASLKKRLTQRATMVSRLATPIIDFLSEKKYEFDAKMLSIMTTPGILPKS